MPSYARIFRRTAPYKAEWSYSSIPLCGERSVNAVGTYEKPYEAMASIKGHAAFYPSRVPEVSSCLRDLVMQGIRLDALEVQDLRRGLPPPGPEQPTAGQQLIAAQYPDFHSTMPPQAGPDD